ncbi:N-acetylneuraminate synthase family protein [Candidatus Harpocratesius sp.]
MKYPKVIAEIGCNHKGDPEIAKEMIKVAKIFGNADVVKFQKRNPKELLSEEEYNAPHPVPYNSYGETYGLHREFLEFDIETHEMLKKYAEKIEIKYSCSVWDMTSTKEIISLEPEMIKIPSATNLNFEILDYVCKNYPGEIHLSLGMTTQEEIEEIIQFFEKRNRNQDLVIYHCSSGYPVPFEKVYLLEIPKLLEKYGPRVKSVGFSGHHLGIAADVAAYALGAEWFERHFTLDRTWKGTDHAASLEPGGLRKLVRDLQAIHKCFQNKPSVLDEMEIEQRKKLKKIKRI